MYARERDNIRIFSCLCVSERVNIDYFLLKYQIQNIQNISSTHMRLSTNIFYLHMLEAVLYYLPHKGGRKANFTAKGTRKLPHVVLRLDEQHAFATKQPSKDIFIAYNCQ